MPNYPAFIMHIYTLKTSLLFLCFYVGFCSIPPSVQAQADEEMQVLQLYYQDNDLVVSATRAEKTISQVAENIAVVTADDIVAMNAHTVAEVLNTVTGLHLSNFTGPGSPVFLTVQGSSPNHVTVLIDGVVQNNLSDGFPDVGGIRVQQVSRIEIIKGPASSSWGSSLGGVINIITKSPDDSREFGGTISTSIGSQSTGDYRGEISGTAGTLGYYLAGGGLLSDGLQPHTMLQSGNLYSKFQWQPSNASTLTLTLDYANGSRGLGEFPPPDGLSVFNRDNRFSSTLSLNQKLTGELSLDLNFRTLQTKTEIKYSPYHSDEELWNIRVDESTFGGSSRLTWKQQWHTLVFGNDFDFGTSDSQLYANGSQNLDKWAFYVNDTIQMGHFSLTPGARYDNTSSNGDFWSPSLGATCTIDESTVIRGYVARGFSLPPLSYTFGSGFNFLPNPSLKMEKVWSYSAGFETVALKYFWLKTSYFRHDISDAIEDAPLLNKFTKVNTGKQRREGVEVELKTKPVFNLSLMGGFTFINAKDTTTGEIIKNVPRYSYDIGAQYDNSRIIKVLLKGRYVDWNTSPGAEGKYDAMIWDLNMSKGINLSDVITAEVFFIAHNLFNGAQYALSFYQNPRRWFEGGIRFAF